MCLSHLVSVPVGLLLCVGATAAADLSQINRAIQKEPAYQSKPKYCLLVFGPEAKHRVWLVLDGDVLYVDKNDTGDLTGDEKRIKAPSFTASTHPAHAQERSIEVGDLSVAGLTHTKLAVSQTQYRRKVDASGIKGGSTPQQWQDYLDTIWRQIPDGLVYMVSIELDPTCYGWVRDKRAARVRHFAWIDGQGQLAFADRPQAAPIIHFGGPLTLRANPAEKLQRGKVSEDLSLCLGTPGLGPGAFATMGHDHVPKNVHPVVELRFPAKEPGVKPLDRKYVLKERC
jgi:hypothetical protein